MNGLPEQLAVYGVGATAAGATFIFINSGPLWLFAPGVMLLVAAATGFGIRRWERKEQARELARSPEVNRLRLAESMPLRYVTADYVTHERNQEVRAILMRRLGTGTYAAMIGAKPVYQSSYLHDEQWGTLYTDGARFKAVQVKNSTPNPDGTFKEYWLRVPGDGVRQPPRFCRLCGVTISEGSPGTAKAAIAWTFGLCSDHYMPAVMS